jgi:hypothetical protein
VEYELSDLATTLIPHAVALANWAIEHNPDIDATVRHTTRAPRHPILRPDFVILKYVAASHGIYADDLLTARSRVADRPAHRCSAGRANPGLENCYGA